ncbi:MAG: hypothetical protein SFU27_06525 [Thermonemataceae bacterium]|nr:hypothetical protein [Thermonemataceae bacterium]
MNNLIRPLAWLGISLITLSVWLLISFLAFKKMGLKQELKKEKQKADSLQSVIETQEKTKDLETKDTILSNEIRKNSDSVDAAKQFFGF